MKKLYLVLVLTTLILFTALAKAQSQTEPLEPGEEDFADSSAGDFGNDDSDPVTGVQLGQVQLAGSGCSGDTARAVLSPDGKAVSILFDNFVAQAGGNAPRRTELSCTTRIPIQTPPGYQAMVTRLDYRGFASVAPSGGRAVLKTFFQILNWNNARPLSPVIKRRKVFNQQRQGGFVTTSRLRVRNFYHGCGEKFLLNVDTRLIGVSRTGRDETFIALDTTDVSSKVTYFLRWKRCR
ncbi:hypothetical protein AZI86_08780 [Bdellovibrio bacteriovorus]|uniref:DUF4360 domain-containing protein n=1 Tax=Bdellovibrio bacteriovorus TaxID=959 RepID=A0A150WRT8_BDEBC|nr:DUF4360 domain-containing protein [Bdellovibrio bacteriovorus]KYG67096.1 hypothetical protein AZI86_08780 [Bdellovibrio bacteriovorus]